MSSSPRSFPSVFVSHGAPTLAIESNDTTDFLHSLHRGWTLCSLSMGAYGFGAGA
jgi:aromatic ring-opening dioxygenase catalytic subunit (LigB family)